MFRESEPSMLYELMCVRGGGGLRPPKSYGLMWDFGGGGLEIPKTSLHMIWGGDRLEECFGPGDRLDVSILSILSRMEKSHTVINHPLCPYTLPKYQKYPKNSPAAGWECRLK